MKKRELIAAPELSNIVSGLRGWTVADGALHKEFRFDDFVRAFGFMAQVALIAERMNHHPDWSNVYNTVAISLTTHDLGGISTFDIEFASQVDQLLSGET